MHHASRGLQSQLIMIFWHRIVMLISSMQHSHNTLYLYLGMILKLNIFATIAAVYLTIVQDWAAVEAEYKYLRNEDTSNQYIGMHFLTSPKGNYII